MMKLITGTVLTAMFMAPAWACAQQAGAPLTREQVRAQVVALQKIGYEGITADDIRYPDNLQAALARLTAQASSPASLPGQ